MRAVFNIVENRANSRSSFHLLIRVFIGEYIDGK